MPRGNGMGPNGQGPMTGRGAGTCAGADAPGFATGGPGRRMGGGGRYGFGGGGRRRGGGMGRRNRFFGDVAAWWKGQDASDTELAALKSRAEEISAVSAGIQARIAELEAASEKTE